MLSVPPCRDSHCLTGESSVCRITEQQYESFTPLAWARVKLVPCRTLPGLFHTARRAEIRPAVPGPCH